MASGCGQQPAQLRVVRSDEKLGSGLRMGSGFAVTRYIDIKQRLPGRGPGWKPFTGRGPEVPPRTGAFHLHRARGPSTSSQPWTCPTVVEGFFPSQTRPVWDCHRTGDQARGGVGGQWGGIYHIWHTYGAFSPWEVLFAQALISHLPLEWRLFVDNVLSTDLRRPVCLFPESKPCKCKCLYIIPNTPCMEYMPTLTFDTTPMYANMVCMECLDIYIYIYICEDLPSSNKSSSNHHISN